MILAVNYLPFRDKIARKLKFFEQRRPEETGCREIVSEEARRYAEMKRFVSAVREDMSFEELKKLSFQFDGVDIFTSDRSENFRRDGAAARHEVRLDCHGFSVRIGFGNTPEEAVASGIRSLKERYS